MRRHWNVLGRLHEWVVGIHREYIKHIPVLVQLFCRPFFVITNEVPISKLEHKASIKPMYLLSNMKKNKGTKM